jgi:hypothetical protein
VLELTLAALTRGRFPVTLVMAGVKSTFLVELSDKVALKVLPLGTVKVFRLGGRVREDVVLSLFVKVMVLPLTVAFVSDVGTRDARSAVTTPELVFITKVVPERLMVRMGEGRVTLVVPSSDQLRLKAFPLTERPVKQRGPAKFTIWRRSMLKPGPELMFRLRTEPSPLKL